jgi:heme-degrading monooxygenase HmoA
MPFEIARQRETSEAHMFAKTPAPPYYAVIFTSKRTDVDAAGYAAMADAMADMAAKQPGYLGHESARDNGVGITVSYWRDEASLKNWKQVSEHLAGQKIGRERWYSHYETRVAKVERAYSGPEGRQ